MYYFVTQRSEYLVIGFFNSDLGFLDYCIQTLYLYESFLCKWSNTDYEMQTFRLTVLSVHVKR